MEPNKQWQMTYMRKRKLLVPDVDLYKYFEATEIGGKILDILDMGQVNIPTGKILVRDPLCYLNKDEEPYFVSIPSGKYPLAACVVVAEDEDNPEEADCDRYAAVKLQINSNRPYRLEEALIGIEDLSALQPGDFFGFNVDAGLATIIDVATRDAFAEFLDQWQHENGNKNVYDDFFAKQFETSYKLRPEYQRAGGDWINWTIPGTDLNVPMFQTGFGDGAYPVYFGYDRDEKVCCIIIQFIDIESAYSEDLE